MPLLLLLLMMMVMMMMMMMAMMIYDTLVSDVSLPSHRHLTPTSCYPSAAVRSTLACLFFRHFVSQ